MAWLLLGAQVGALGVVVLLPRRPAAPLAWWSGVVLAAAGLVVLLMAVPSLGRGFSALPLPSRNAQLTTGGLYRYVRHPMYSGFMLFGVGWLVAVPSLPRLFAVCFLVAVLMVKARWEESRLMKRFPGYAGYAARTPRFVPSPQAWPTARRDSRL